LLCPVLLAILRWSRGVGSTASSNSQSRGDDIVYPAKRAYEEHSETEERWLTLGEDENGALLVVSHTFEELGDEEALVRVISAREATAHERAQYESG
jgi:uncharacterized DUF497 family protein